MKNCNFTHVYNAASSAKFRDATLPSSATPCGHDPRPKLYTMSQENTTEKKRRKYKTEKKDIEDSDSQYKTEKKDIEDIEDSDSQYKTEKKDSDEEPEVRADLPEVYSPDEEFEDSDSQYKTEKYEETQQFNDTLVVLD